MDNMNVLLSTSEIALRLRPLMERYGVQFAGVFGSQARGEAKPTSDIDLLVRFTAPKSLLDLVAIENAMSETVGRKVDLITERSLHPYLKQSVLRDLKVVYDRS